MENALKKVCERITERQDNQMNNWHWQQGVALAGLSEAYKKTDYREYRDYIEKWTNERLSVKRPGYSINTTAPLIALIDLCEEVPKKEYLDICKDFAAWCLTSAPRSERGAYEHSCVDNVYDNQVWADTLFMGAIFLAKYSLFTGEKMYMNEAVRQYLLHYKFLKADDCALILHGYFGNEREKRGVIWGRGNGWFAVGSPIMLSLLDKSHPDYNNLKENFVKFMTDAVQFQNEDGSFNTVINDKNSYSEMTVTASFAFALNEGVKNGWLDESFAPFAEKAYEALLKNIDTDGTVLNASGGTSVMPNAADYNKVGCYYSPFAQGLAILALSSRLS